MKERLLFWRPFRNATSEKEVARARNELPLGTQPTEGGYGTQESRVAKTANRSVALACDWLTTPGGAEKVLLELHHMYPEAPIYTSQYRKKGINWFDDAEIHTGWLQIFPAALRKFLGPLRQLYFSHLNLTSYDLVISVTGAEAKSLRAKTHLCYCHVPTQYYWQMYDKYVENPGFGFLNPLVRLCFKLLVKPLRKADYKAAQKPTQFITISTYAAAQIKQYYHRDSVIIAPPVDTEKFSTTFPPQPSDFSTRNPQPNPDFSTNQQNISTDHAEKSTESANNSTGISTESEKKSTKSAEFSTKNRELSTSFPQEIHSQTPTFPQTSKTPAQPSQTFPLPSSVTHQSPTSHPPVTQSPLPESPFVISCRQVTWKRVDLAIEACLATNSPLLVIGDGPEHKNLVKLAHNSPLITFIPWLETAELASYLQTAKAYLFPSLEPFGIAAVEALAAGCPVIAYAEGGSRDFVHDHGPGKNGLLFPEQTAESLAEAIQSFDPAAFDPAVVRKSAEKFSPDVFRQKISHLVAETLAEPADATPATETLNQQNQEPKS